MKISKMQTRNFRSMISKLIMGLVLAALAGSIAAAPARADDWRRERHERREFREHEWREHRGWRDRRVYVAPGPAYVYAPPPVIYAPPPPPPSIDFVFPIHLY